MGVRFSSEAGATPRCRSHKLPLLPLHCDVCTAKGAAASTTSALCSACIHLHSLTYPKHALVVSAPDVSILRSALAAYVQAAAVGDRGTAAAVSLPGVPSPAAESGGGRAAATALQAAVQGCPLVESARRKALDIQAALDKLAANVEAAMVQLEANHDVAMRAVQAGAVASITQLEVTALYESGSDEVRAAAATKRTGLETELVTVDETLGEAISVATALVEAIETCDEASLALQAPGLAVSFAAAQAAVSAIPEQPSTSCFLAVDPMLPTEAIGMDSDISWLRSGLCHVCVVEPPHANLSHEHAAQLQAWLPPGGSSRPGTWKEVYRATTHGFGAAAFHERCDGLRRLLMLVWTKEGGWLFGGFTSAGFSPPNGPHADPEAFLFSLTNTLGGPERLKSKRTGKDFFYHPLFVASFGNGLPPDFFICSNADAEADSFTYTGVAYAGSASTGTHPLARETQKGWLAAEIVAWVV